MGGEVEMKRNTRRFLHARGMSISSLAIGLMGGAGVSVFNSLAPAATVAPAVTPTTGGVGTVYTVSNGTWTNAPTFTYRWYNASGFIAGQITNTYTTVAGDRGGSIYAIVTATSGAFIGVASSNYVAIPPVVASAPVNTSLPSIAGTAQAGQTLIGADGTYSGAPTPTLSRQWNRGGAAISGATGTSYLLSAGDVGSTITFVVTATNLAGSVSATSAPTAAVIAAGSAVALAANPAATPPALTLDIPVLIAGTTGYVQTSDAYHFAECRHPGGAGSPLLQIMSNGTGFNGLTLHIQTDTLCSVGYNAQYTIFPGTINFATASVSAGCTFRIRRQRTTGDIVVTQDGVERYRISSASVTTNASDLIGNTQARIALESGTTQSTGVKIGPDYDATIPLVIQSTIYNVDTRNFDVVIAYYTSLVPTYEISRNGGAYQDIPAYVTTGAGNATLRLPAADIGMNGRATYTLRQKNLTTSSATGAYTIPEPMILGINVGPDALSDLGLTVRWLNPADYNGGIGRLGDYASSPNIIASVDGSGTSVKRDTFGKIYATNGAGLTTYRAMNDSTLCSPGNWNFAFAAGVVISNNLDMTGGGIVTGFAYNSVTGIGSYTVPVGQPAKFNLIISAASIPVGGTGLSLLKQGAVAGFDANAVALIPTIAKEIRYLDAAAVNNANYSNRTPLLMASRTYANRLRVGEWDVETQVAFANACGCGMVYQTKHIDDDTLVSGAADYIAANLVGQARFSLSNEIWNFIFGQWYDVKLMGIRLGMALGSATPGTLVAEPNTFDGTQMTLSNAQAPTWIRGDWSGSVFTENDYGGVYAKLLIAMPAGSQILLNGAGLQVYNTATAQAIGCIFNIQTGVAVSGSTGNFTIKYVSVDTTAAGLRWFSYRMKQIITIVNARFALAGKPNPKYVLESFANGGISYIQPALDWDNLYLLMAGSHVSPGWYYGNGGGGGADLGMFTDMLYAEWTATTGKNALYDTATNPTLAARITAAQTAYFSASGKTVAAVGSAAKTYRDGLITYNLGKSGGLANDIRMGEYEFNWHTIFVNWPDQVASVYVATNTYVMGNIVRQVGSGLFKAVQAVPVSTPPPNATYWVSMASEADYAAGSPSQQLFSSIVLDSRHGADISTHITNLRNVHGGPSYFYVIMSANITESNYFGLTQSYTDTTAANYRYSAVKAARTLIG